jgi:hypothetical protein
MSHRWQFYPIVHFIMVVVHMGLSLVFITAPGTRFSAAAWEPLLDMSRGSTVPWGIVLGVSGILMAFGRIWTDIIGEFIGMCWCSFLSALFIVALEDPQASATGVVVYAGLMAINGALLAQRVIDWVKQHNARSRR